MNESINERIEGRSETACVGGGEEEKVRCGG